MPTAPSKFEKEAFVTGHDGSTPWEILFVCFSAVSGVLLFSSVTMTGEGTDPYSLPSRVILEALVVWFPMVLSQTVFFYPYGIFIVVLQVGVGILLQYLKTGNTPISRSQPTSSKNQPQYRLYLTAYRSSILYLTFIAILAVDFHAFPRRFCKTETKGYGLMDVGAASFCLSAGFVSPRAKRKQTARWNAKQLIHTVPLVVLGLLRIITNQKLEYQEHVSEYGLHWNFFFTMGVLVFVPPLLQGVLPLPGWRFPVGTMVLYQVLLSRFGLQEYIEKAPRQCDTMPSYLTILPDWVCHIFAANREGILGCVGYLSLFWIGEWIGYEFLWKNNNLHPSLWKLCALLWGMVLAFTRHESSFSVSRRSTNLYFCIWAVAHNILLLSLFRWMDSDKIPVVWSSVNRNGLWIFLIANLLTGLVNLTIPTLETSNLWALGIVFAYIVLVGVLALLLEQILSKFSHWVIPRNAKLKTN